MTGLSTALSDGCLACYFIRHRGMQEMPRLERALQGLSAHAGTPQADALIGVLLAAQKELGAHQGLSQSILDELLRVSHDIYGHMLMSRPPQAASDSTDNPDTRIYDMIDRIAP